MSIELSHDELLVLYDLLHRLEDVEEIFEDPSEQEVLWHIQTQLEKDVYKRQQLDDTGHGLQPACLLLRLG